MATNTWNRSVRATADERRRALPGDDLLPASTGLALPVGSLTNAISINRPPQDVWPWIAQMGAGSRGGWYSYDFLDNRHHHSATRIVPDFQPLKIGMLFPALPGVTDAFTLAAFDPERYLVLEVKGPDGKRNVTWTFVLEPIGSHATRLIVRARGTSGPIGRVVIPLVHFIMQRKQLLGLAERVEKPAAFESCEGESAFRTAYDDAMKLWPVPYEDIDVPTPFGMTHAVACGPKNAPPLVLLHGYSATSVMWAPNIADLAKDFRVYAIDVMGQPGKSIPAEPIRNGAGYIAWLTSVLTALKLDRICLVGMSYGGWLALRYALAAPERVQKLALLSPGGLAPFTSEFSLRGLLMAFFPTRFMVQSFMRWLGFRDRPGETAATPVLELMYLGLKHFRVPPGTLRTLPPVTSDEELRALRVPVLLLVGAEEVVFDPLEALARGRRLIPHFEGDLVPLASHDMCFSQREIVDERLLNFLKKTQTAPLKRVS